MEKEDTEEVTITEQMSPSRLSLPDFSLFNTNYDFNKQPPNYMRRRSKLEEMIFKASKESKQKIDPHYSFKLASQFPEKVGNVDIMSASKNLKTLLKMPYANSSHVSMMVHRVGDTCLLDEFDLFSFMLRQDFENWHWLRRFAETNNMIVRPSHKKEIRDAKHLEAKFLYHTAHTENRIALFSGESKMQQIPQSNHSKATNTTIHASSLEEPLRCMLWSCENLKMLLGTNMAIFGGPNNPCISVRLRETSKPISVLTGIDYWLDNMINDVPELAMCYHMNGLFQGFDILKTEDIPEHAGFDPNSIKDIAHNLVWFLRTNATKEGHTYWLFKAPDSEFVKLYDLTSLCQGREASLPDPNPFSTPVGVLCFKVAQNRFHKATTKKEKAQLHRLLKCSLSLLENALNNDIISQCNFLLSELFLTDKSSIANTKPKNNSTIIPASNSSKKKKHSLKQHEVVDAIPKIQLKTLFDKSPEDIEISEDSSSTSTEPADEEYYLPDAVEVRAANACKHAFQCLKIVLLQIRTSSVEHCEYVASANPEIPIPMGWSGDSDSQQKDLLTTDTSLLGSHCIISNSELQSLLKTLVKSYLILAECRLKNLEFRGAFDACYLASFTFFAFRLTKASNESMEFQLYDKIGEVLMKCYYKSLDHRLEKSKLSNHSQFVSCFPPDFENEDSTQQKLEVDGPLRELLVELTGKLLLHLRSSLPPVLEDLQQLSDYLSVLRDTSDFEYLDKAYRCFYLAHQRGTNLHTVEFTSKRRVKLRLAAAMNELARKTALEAKKNSSVDVSVFDPVSWLAKYGKKIDRALKMIRDAIDIIGQIDDDAHNDAYLYANQAFCLRVLNDGKFCMPRLKGGDVLSWSEIDLYDKAIQAYQSGLLCLGSRDSCPTLWDNLSWEKLMCHMDKIQATVTCQVDGMSEEERCKEAIRLYRVALKMCDLESPGERLLSFRYQAAQAHKNVGDMLMREFIQGWSRSSDEAKCRLKWMSSFESCLHLLISINGEADLRNVPMFLDCLGKLVKYQMDVADESRKVRVSSGQLLIHKQFNEEETILRTLALAKYAFEDLEACDWSALGYVLKVLTNQLTDSVKALIQLTKIVKDTDKSALYRGLYADILRRVPRPSDSESEKAKCLQTAFTYLYEWSQSHLVSTSSSRTPVAGHDSSLPHHTVRN